MRRPGRPTGADMGLKHPTLAMQGAETRSHREGRGVSRGEYAAYAEPIATLGAPAGHHLRSSAAIPGRNFPSNISSAAPPPVET